MKETRLSLEEELISKIDEVLQKLKGSQWSIYRFDKLYGVLHTINVSRSGSYIKTPEKYSKRGLINIKNDDNECFKHCLAYHQSKQEQNYIRLTSLSKVNNIYNVNDIAYPTSLEDVKIFEN